MTFPFLTIFIVFILWLAYRLRKASHSREEKDNAFWAKERAASTTSSKDINNLDYLTIPLDKFPLNFTDNSEVKELESELTELSTHKLLNLTGISNTDLKLAYGTGNFDAMSQIGSDFDRLTIVLNNYAKKCIELDNIPGSISILEYAVGIKTDISESYKLLAQCYKKENKNEKLKYLISQIENSELILKTSILEQIKDA